MELIKFDNVKYSYHGGTESQVEALSGVSFAINEGEFVALVGHNGSGKSTIAKLVNGLILPEQGQVTVDGNDTTDYDKLFDIRKTVGVVFQNPDNQMIATIIEDDIAFGPENLGLPPAQIAERVDWALSCVGMLEHKKGTPFRLSGGQKQRIAIAGVLAIKPRVMVLDESTAMLDPIGRHEVMEVVKRLNKQEKMTVIMITHFMEEALEADRIIVLNNGLIEMSGGREIFLQEKKLDSIGLDVPIACRIANQLRLDGVNLAQGIVDENALIEGLTLQNFDKALSEKTDKNTQNSDENSSQDSSMAVEISNLNYVYSRKTPFEKYALKNINLSIADGEFFGVIGHTGSGKSTLISHLNALTRIQEGDIAVNGINLKPKKIDFLKLRSIVGMVFQYPEYQLFDETVERDVGFGPRNLRLEEKEILERVKKAITLVGLDYDLIKDRSPFELSGGQKRRVALAGVLAMQPKILVLDEPTAGLDPRGKREILELIKHIKSEMCPTIIMISHNMDEVAQYCDRIAVMHNGTIACCLEPCELFSRNELLQELNISMPAVTRIANTLCDKGMAIERNIVRESELVEKIKNAVQVDKSAPKNIDLEVDNA